MTSMQSGPDEETRAAGAGTPAPGDSAAGPLDAAIDDLLDPFRDERPVDGRSTSELFAELYDVVRGLAGKRMHGQRANHTLQATALIHDAYVRLSHKEREWSSRAHFLLAVARTFRHILIDHEEVRRARKRTRPDGGPIEEEYVMEIDAGLMANVLDLDEQLRRLHARGDRWAWAFLFLRCYADATIDEIAEVLETPQRTTERRWKALRAWLRDTLDPE